MIEVPNEGLLNAEEHTVKGRLVALVGPDQVEIHEYDLPELPPGAVLLKVRRANVCGSDLHIWHFLSVAMRDVAMGHEFVAEIAELGPGVTTDSAGQPVSVGDRVAAVYYHTCLKCPACGRGDFAMCHNSGRNMGLPPTTPPHFNGGFATHYYVSPGQFFYKVPDRVSDAAAAGANCGLAQMLYSIDKLGIRRGQSVVVQGAGGLGLYAAAVASTCGARVIVVEKEPVRIALAREFGAQHVVDISDFPTVESRTARILELTQGIGADAVIEVTGRPSAFTEAIDYARIGASIASIGNLNVGKDFEVSFAPALITRKQVTIVGILRYDPWYLKEALNFLDEYREDFPFDDLSDRVFRMDEITEALELSEARVVSRAAIIP